MRISDWSSDVCSSDLRSISAAARSVISAKRAIAPPLLSPRNLVSVSVRPFSPTSKLFCLVSASIPSPSSLRRTSPVTPCAPVMAASVTDESFVMGLSPRPFLRQLLRPQLPRQELLRQQELPQRGPLQRQLLRSPHPLQELPLQEPLQRRALPRQALPRPEPLRSPLQIGRAHV